jgi:adenosylmethionine---8-amino-7-oxononanoate aminotransferase
MKRPSAVWHPFTQHAIQPEAIPVARAEGAYLETAKGKRIYDGISSWWVITHGHRHPAVMQAMREQGERLDQVIFAGFTHEPAERVAADLITLAGKHLAADSHGPLSHVFFSDSGSTAVEVALKMALGYWKNTGEKRTRIIALEHAYHGDTIGTMSAGARGVFNAAYDPLLFDVARIPFPSEGQEALTLEVLETLLNDEPAAALIVEPLVLGAGGMLMYPGGVVAGMKSLCERTGTLFIADEVMTAWGRTGTLFACEQAGIQPDILCLAKGLTGGSIPLAVTLCTERIFEAHYSTDRSKTFFHSSSYTANAIACAAAAANIAIWNSEPVTQRLAQIADWHCGHLTGLQNDDRFANVRRSGTIAAADLKVRDAGYLAGIGPKLYAFFLDRGLLLRPLGNTIYVMPPYCSTADDLDAVYAAIRSAADELT